MVPLDQVETSTALSSVTQFLLQKVNPTIAALLERFYDPQEGGIYVDGNPLQELDPSWLRGQAIGYINQVSCWYGGQRES